MAFACWCALTFVLAGLGLGRNRTAFFKELKGGYGERERDGDIFTIVPHGRKWNNRFKLQQDRVRFSVEGKRFPNSENHSVMEPITTTYSKDWKVLLYWVC